MWIVRLALSRPRSTFVCSMLLVIFGIMSIVKTPTDIFPAINIPVVDIVWNYGGLSPQEMAYRVTNQCERTLNNNIGDIEHIESTSVQGTSVIKVYLQQGSDVPSDISEISASCEQVMHSMPPGMTAPMIIRFDASDVPIVQIELSSDILTAPQIVDQAQNFLPQYLATIKGVRLSPPYGGVFRLINVDMDPQKMFAKGVTPQDLTAALANQNLTLPSGDAKIGPRDYVVQMNNAPTVISELNDLPVKIVNGDIVHVGDVAFVHSGHSVQTSMVDVNGKAAVLLTILKNGDASTLDVISRIKKNIPLIKAVLPEGLDLNLLLDQSVFVRAAITNVVREGVIAACLTALMILLFLGSWRSMLIVFISIPLAILCSIIVLAACGQTLNSMTLGGLALAVGILVDDATVEIENTNRNLGLGLRLKDAILTSAEQVALPALSSTLAICIVFSAVLFLSGVARSLFLPMALAVVFAMIPSYILSRALVTNMMYALLGPEVDKHTREARGETVPPRNWVDHAHNYFEKGFHRLHTLHWAILGWALGRRKLILAAMIIFIAISACLLPFIGENFFPTVDSGQMRLHIRCPSGTRLEETGRTFAQIEGSIRQIIPANQISLILDNIGLAGSSNRVFDTSGTIGPFEGEVDISLTAKHRPTIDYQRELRSKLRVLYPAETFYFQPPDITSQILDFGVTAPIDIQVTGPVQNQTANLAIAKQVQASISSIPGVVDTYIGEVTDAPGLFVDVNRDRAMEVGLTQQDVASSILDSLASSSQTAPSYFLDPSNGVQYTVSAQTPQYRIDSVDALLATPVAATSTGVSGGSPPQLLANLATVSSYTTSGEVSHYNVQPLYNVYASPQDRDMGSISRAINRALIPFRKHLPRGSTITVAGQITTMNQSYVGLAGGLVLAVVLIYILLVINFESWIDPFIILMALPAALCGVLWMLFVTQTTFSVPALMGTIMCLGISSANSILLVTFANEQRREGKNSVEAALAAGYVRLRPVIMTALAMLMGCLPMALGLGEGGEQNAPLGRAVIGGLIVATISTLVFVPVAYSFLRRHDLEKTEEDLAPAPHSHWSLGVPGEQPPADGAAPKTNGAHPTDGAARARV